MKPVITILRTTDYKSLIQIETNGLYRYEVRMHWDNSYSQQYFTSRNHAEAAYDSLIKPNPALL